MARVHTIAMRIVLALTLAVLLGGCAHRAPPPLACSFVKYPLTVAVPPDGAALTGAASDDTSPTIEARIRQALDTPLTAPGGIPPGAPPAAPSPAPAPKQLLFLSGGSQWGAFGAGWLDGWSLAHGGLPRFAVVTGVSTGAILATFAFTGHAAAAARGYAINSERQLLTPFGGGVVGIAQHGAVADLAPLRRHLAAALDDDILGQVAAGSAQGRLLLVGAVDADSGEAVALDLTDMAARWAAAAGTARATLKTCYIEGVVASSSAPLAAPPVFIDHHLYIDGGARFGIFSDLVAALIPGPSVPGAPPLRTAYLIVNGDLQTAPYCDPAKPCTPLADSWSIVSLGLRSVNILQNQVARFSLQAAAQKAQTNDAVRIAIIGSDSDAFDYRWGPPLDAADTLIETGSRSCAAWRDRDTALDNPVQFHPRFMRCLIAYGRTKAAASGW